MWKRESGTAKVFTQKKNRIFSEPLLLLLRDWCMANSSDLIISASICFSTTRPSQVTSSPFFWYHTRFGFREPVSTHISALSWGTNHLSLLILANLAQPRPLNPGPFDRSTATLLPALSFSFRSKIFGDNMIFRQPMQYSWSHFLPAPHPRKSRGISEVLFTLRHRCSSSFVSHVTYCQRHLPVVIQL